jgi:hypothetical protein
MIQHSNTIEQCKVLVDPFFQVSFSPLRLARRNAATDPPDPEQHHEFDPRRDTRCAAAKSTT